MTEIIFLFVGVLAGYSLCRWLVTARPVLAARLREDFLLDHGYEA